MTALRHLDVALLPVELSEVDAECYLVIDVLRATTTIAVLLARGAAEVRVVSSIPEARAFAEGAVLAGEERGFRPQGFDLGNSPTEAAAAAIEGKRVVMATTNGTHALLAAAGRGTVIAASLVNLSAAAAAAAAYRRVAIVCAGTHRGSRFAVEDFATAALYVARLAGEASHLELGDGALLAAQLARAADAPAMVRSAAHARYLAAAGFGPDIEYALRIDSWPVVPHVAASGAGWAALRL